MGNLAKTGKIIGAAFLCASVAFLCVAIPMYVIRPFRPQGARELALALTVRELGPWISAACALAALLVVIRLWKQAAGWMSRIVVSALFIVTLACACLTHVNIFEIMFHRYDSPAFGSASGALIDADDKVLSVSLGSEAHAYPIRTMGYHHIVNDTVGNAPIAVTYCTLCHTGMVWSRVVGGRVLVFRLAGINNGNALMRDEQTGSIWQQSTGQAIFGALKGSQLALVHSDELTFGLWHKEQPGGLVLQPDAKYAAEYESKDWETHIEKTHTVIDTRKSGIPPHELMLGVTIGAQNKAYPVRTILASKLIQDQIDGNSIVILVGPDDSSIRIFQGNIATTPMTFVRSATSAGSAASEIMVDAETGSQWNFKGCAIAGKLSGQCLQPLDGHKDYWFDWMNHHPETAVFKN
jgi:hypothetical protein